MSWLISASWQRWILLFWALDSFSPNSQSAVALGVFTILRNHSMEGIAVGSYLFCIGINYVPLLLHAISLVRLGSARHEIAEGLTDKRHMFRKYRRQSLLLLVPLAVPVLAAAHELRRNTSTEYPSSVRRETFVRRHPVLAYFVLFSDDAICPFHH